MCLRQVFDIHGLFVQYTLKVSLHFVQYTLEISPSAVCIKHIGSVSACCLFNAGQVFPSSLCLTRKSGNVFCFSILNAVSPKDFLLTVLLVQLLLLLIFSSVEYCGLRYVICEINLNDV
jgi:hypothetical protein